MNVLFVVMPFGSIRPNIGVSLLKSHLARIDVASRVLYLSMPYAQRVGPALYNDIAQEAPTQSLAGDWIFRACLSGPRADADECYLNEYEERFLVADNPNMSRKALELCRSVAEPFVAECLESVDWQSYDVVGFTSTFAQHVAALGLAKRVKERFPHILIAFGGANCEETMGLQTHRSFPFVDFVCSGEADRSFPQLVQALCRRRVVEDRGRSVEYSGGSVEDNGRLIENSGCPVEAGGCSVEAIDGVISRRDGVSRFSSLSPRTENDLDSLPTPDYADYFEQLQKYQLTTVNGDGVPMESARGCWWGQKHHCTFCGLNGTSMTFRSKSARRVLEEIDESAARYQQRQFAMVDNILDMKYFKDLLPALQRRQMKLALFYETKANLTKAQLLSMKEAEIVVIQPGIESLSSEVLRLMRKGTTALQNIQLLKWCREIGIVPHWNLLYGFPGERPSEYQEMAQMMDALHHLQPPHGISRIRLDRFSPNFFDAAKLGLINVRPDRTYSHIYDLPQSDISEMAYFFAYDYADGRDPETYTGAARDAVIRWQANHTDRGLIYVDHGNTLAIWDFRTNAKRIVTVLNARERAVYLYCDQHRSLQQILALRELADDTGSLASLLEEWTNNRLMIALNGQYLALAVRAEPSPACGGTPETEALQAH
jgi:ribosomal peptide maturation radical SAM protein 1